VLISQLMELLEVRDERSVYSTWSGWEEVGFLDGVVLSSNRQRL